MLKNIFKKTSVIIISSLLAISSLLFYAFNDDNATFEISKNLDIFYTLFRELNIYYVDETDPGDLIKTGIDKMLESLDPYTIYIPESQMENYKFMTTGQYGGIGALIRKSGKYIVVSEPYEDFPAHSAGLKAGDIIIEIDEKSTENKSTSDISKALKGQPDSEVKLKINRPGTEEVLEKTLVRQKIKIKSVPYFGMLTDDIGYIKLSQFTQKAGNKVKEAFLELKEKHNASKIILDLRNNPGGLLIESVHICNIFMDKGQEIVRTKGKISQWDKTYYAMHSAVDTEIPVVVLVNRGSASASEIVSGAFQDSDRGVIIGERTFGKGLVQTTRTLSYNTKLKITTAKYYIPSGRCIQALDYTHRNEDGSVGKIQDSLMTEFKTKNGRKVFDGGGILPDITIEQEFLSNISTSLFIKNLIFDYATEYSIKHDSILQSKEYRLSDTEYNDFKKFISDKEFDYETNSEEQLKKLIKISKKEKYFKMSEKELKELETKLVHDKDKDLNTFKEEIINLLTEEIVSRYYFQQGRIESLLVTDKNANKAVEILNDMELYNSILAGTDTISGDTENK